MKLVTISDLEQSYEVKKPLIETAMKLGDYYDQFKAQDTGSRSYSIHIGGDGGRGGGIHASEISRCMRLLTYSVANTERKPVRGEDTDPNMRMRFDIGHAVHAMLQNDFKRMCEWMNNGARYVTFEDEIRIRPEYQAVAQEWGIESSCDGLFTFWNGDEPYLRVGLEIKTKSGPEFEKTTKPDAEHLEQTCLYQAALDVPLMWTLYYNKSNSNYMKPSPPYLFQFDKHMWENKLEPRFHKVHHLVEEKQLPPRQEGNHCRWCPFAWTCQPVTLKSRRSGLPATTMQSPGALRAPGK